MVTLTGKINSTLQPLNTNINSSLALYYELWSFAVPQGQSTLSSSINSIDTNIWLASKRD
jgi:hypothetical protein